MNLKKNYNITFLFPLFNEEERINSNIKIIKYIQKKFKNYLVVFILNNCTDNTHKKIKKSFSKNDLCFRIIRCNSNKRGNGINKALKLVKCKYFAICAIDDAWGEDFYNRAYKLIKKKYDVIYGPKNHIKSIVKRNIIRNIISRISIFYLKLLYGNLMDQDSQCIKLFRSDITFLKNLHNYNYFAETEFFILSKINKLKYKNIPIKVSNTKGSKVKLFKLLEYMIEALCFKFFLLLNKKLIEKNHK
tara:strand:+ start:1844 stop:2581 length:738 start_codon:yes stop_codon:yes gene_type:complete